MSDLIPNWQQLEIPQDNTAEPEDANVSHELEGDYEPED